MQMKWPYGVQNITIKKMERYYLHKDSQSLFMESWHNKQDIK